MCVYDWRMRPFRMEAGAPPDPGCAIRVIGWRMPFLEPVRGIAHGWFLFHFHHRVRALTEAGEEALPGDTVLVVPQDHPLAHRPLEHRLLRSWIRCDGPRVAALLEHAGLRPRRPYRLARDHDLDGALLALHRACSHPHRSAGLEQSLLTAWAQIVVRDADRSPVPLGMDAVRAHIEADAAAPHRLDALARLAGCSRAQLCRRFRRAVGLSPMAYVARLRLERARELLATTIQPIPAIAAACGFADRYHLTRAFHRHFGDTPARCRQRLHAS